MQLHIGHDLTSVNPEPNGSLSGRGLLQRPYADRVCLAASYLAGELRLDPSFKQTCETFHVSPADLRKELRRRAALNGGNGSEGDPVDNLVALWAVLSAAERERVVRIISPGEVWDALSAVVA